MQYRKLPLENLSRFEGVGIYYGATFVEAQLCGKEEEVIVIAEETRLVRLQCFWRRLQNVYTCWSDLAVWLLVYLIRRIEES